MVGVILPAFGQSDAKRFQLTESQYFKKNEKIVNRQLIVLYILSRVSTY